MSDTAAPAGQAIPAVPAFSPGLPWLGPMLAYVRDPLGFSVAGYRACGPVFRTRLFGRRVLVLAGIEANRLVWEQDQLWDFAVTGAIFRENFDATYLTQLDGPAHTRKRRRLQAGFKPQALLGLSPLMSAALVEELGAAENTIVDLRLFCSRLVVCMSSRALMHVRLPEGLDQRIAAFEHDLLFGGRLPPWLRKWWYGRRSYRRLKRELLAYIEQMLAEKKANPSPAEDIISIIAKSPAEGEPPPGRDEMVTDIALLLLAGSNTTSSVILWSLLFVFSRPDWLASLREELKDWDPAHFTGMADLPRLKATVLETERLRPALPFAVRSAREAFLFHGHAFPAGTFFLHAATTTHFLEEIYEKPLEFYPERFLPQGNPPAKAHATFGGGSHVCLGQPLARIQEPLMLATLIQSYDLVCPKPPSLRPRLAAVLTPADKAIPARLVRRVQPA
jgi:cytochrome P450